MSFNTNRGTLAKVDVLYSGSLEDDLEFFGRKIPQTEIMGARGKHFHVK